MDPVNGISQIVRILRRKLGDHSPGRARATAANKPGHTPASKPGLDEIRQRVSARIRALPAEERQGPRAAQVFVESLIAWEFGEQVMADPKAAELSKDILDSIAADDQTSAKLRELLQQL